MTMKAKDIIEILLDKGYEAFYVGGRERDIYLGKPFNDEDITTNATPEQIVEIFKDKDVNIKLVGARFKVVKLDDIEVATYRIDEYNENYELQNVRVATSIAEDISRRDFTMNGMYSDIHGNVYDIVGAKNDLDNKLIRAIGSPKQRFLEDPNRMLRALSFASILDFKIEENTAQAIRDNKDLLKDVPMEVKGLVLEKVMKKNVLSKYVRLLNEFDLLQYTLPSIAHTVGALQNPKYHCYDVFEHILKVIEYVEQTHPKQITLLLAALYHDNAKNTEGVRTGDINDPYTLQDIGHEEAGVERARKELHSFSYPSKVVDDVLFLVEYHGLKIDSFKEKSVRKFALKVAKTTNHDDFLYRFKLLMNFKTADANGFAEEFKNQVIDKIETFIPLLSKVLWEDILFVKQLPVDGKWIISKGFTGKDIGKALDYLVARNVKTIEEAELWIKQVPV